MSNNKTFQAKSTRALSRRKKERQDILFTAPLILKERYLLKISETSALFDKSKYSTNTLTSQSKGLLGYLIYLKSLIRTSSKFKVIHLFYVPGMSLFAHILPVVIVGRFFGCQVVLDNRNINRFDIWHNISFFFKHLLQMFSAVMVLSDLQKLVLADLNIKNGSIPDAVEIVPGDIKLVRDIQPKILVKVENKKLNKLNYLFSAFEMVKQKYPRCEMVIAVDKPETFNFHLNGVSYVTPAVAAQDQEVDLFVNWTRFDYLDSSILEAMKRGLPVISTPVTMIDKFKNGENIIFVRYHDHSALADRIIELIENPEFTEKLSLQGPLTAGNFSAQAIAARWQKFYSQLLS